MEEFVRQTLGRAGEQRNPRALCLCEHALGAVCFLRGDWRESRAALERSLVLAESVGATFGIILGLQRLAVLETAIGDHDAGRTRLERALALARASDSLLVQVHSTGRVLISLAGNRFAAGDLAAATDYLAQAFAMQQMVGECTGCDALLYPTAVPIYLALGDFDQAEQVCRKAEQVAEAFGSRAWTAGARYLRGLVDTARGDWGGGAAHLSLAAQIFEQLGQPYDLALVLRAQAELAERSGGAEPGLDTTALRRRADAVFDSLMRPTAATA